MNTHQNLYRPPSNSNLSSLSKESGGSGAIDSNNSNSRPRPRPRLLTKFHRLISPTCSVFGGLKASPSPLTAVTTTTTNTTSASSSCSAAEPFRIVHERDETPAYTPVRPMQPRTNSECKEALEEMFARARGEGSPLEETAKTARMRAEQQQQQRPNQRYVNYFEPDTKTTCGSQASSGVVVARKDWGDRGRAHLVIVAKPHHVK